MFTPKVCVHEELKSLKWLACMEPKPGKLAPVKVRADVPGLDWKMLDAQRLSCAVGV
jgi:hypothetical protein